MPQPLASADRSLQRGDCGRVLSAWPRGNPPGARTGAPGAAGGCSARSSWAWGLPVGLRPGGILRTDLARGPGRHRCNVTIVLMCVASRTVGLPIVSTGARGSGEAHGASGGGGGHRGPWAPWTWRPPQRSWRSSASCVGLLPGRLRSATCNVLLLVGVALWGMRFSGACEFATTAVVGWVDAGSGRPRRDAARGRLAEPMRVTSVSMSPTLGAGDHVIIDKLTGRWRPPAIGDLVVFREPGGGPLAVKRIVALGGQSVAIEDGVLHVDGVAQDEPQSTHEGSTPSTSDRSRSLRERCSSWATTAASRSTPGTMGLCRWAASSDEWHSACERPR